jgi:hypothetical protein
LEVSFVRRIHLLGAVVLSSAVVAGLVALPAGGQTPTGQTLTFKELNKGSTFKFIDTPPAARNKQNPAFSVGDQLIFSNPLAASPTTTAGKLYVHCTVVSAGKFRSFKALCEGAYTLKNGTLFASAVLGLSSNTTGAITGGTGVYANTHGTFVSTEGKAASTTVITLIP